MKEDLILVGGGGHCRSCIDVIELQDRYRVVGVVDVRENLGKDISGYKIIGTDEDLKDLAADCRNFLVTLGQVKSPRRRIEIFGMLEAMAAVPVTIVSPLAHVARTARVGRGSIVMHHALVAAGAVVGDNCIVNDKALIEHDARIGGHCHISTAAVVNGAAVIGEGTFLGSGAVVSHEVEIAPGCVIGAGALVYKSVRMAGTYAGNPLRKLADA